MGRHKRQPARTLLPNNKTRTQAARGGGTAVRPRHRGDSTGTANQLKRTTPMLRIKEFGRRFLMMLRRGKLNRELAEEMRLHVDLRTDEYSKSGVMTDEARALARRQFGNATLLHEQSHDEWGWAWIDRLLVDVRLAARQLRSAPGFTVLVILILAVGIGATTAIFSALNPILFESLPYPAARQIVTIWEISSAGARNDGTFGMYKGLAERSRSLDSLAV